MLTTSVITDAATFADLKAEWNDVLHAAASRAPFLTWEWMHAWWMHLRGTATLNLVTVRCGEELVAVAPLLVVQRGLMGPQLEFLGTGFAGSDYLDLIIRCGFEDEAVDAIAKMIDAQQQPLHLDHLPPSSLAMRLQQRLTPSGWNEVSSSPDVCPFIELTGYSWESYLANLGSSHRANVRRRLRALNADFDVRFALAESIEDRRAALEALFGFHEQRWDARGGSTAFANPRLRAFHHDVCDRAGAGGWLRLYVLSLNGKMAAVMYGFAFDGRFYFYQHGFNHAYTNYGLGLVLMALTIREAIGEGMDEFDMLYGHEPYKYLWARLERPLGRLQLFPPHIGGALLRGQVEARRALRTFAHQIGWRGRHA